MSRSHRRPSDYSRGSSPRIDRTLSVTEASFQNLGLNETAGAQYQSGPSSYLLPDQRSRRPSYPRSGLNSGYLQPDYVSSSYTRAASPASFSALENSTSFGTTLLDPSDYQLFSGTGTFSSRISPFSTGALGRTDMGYPYPSDTMTSYRDTSSYGPSRSPSQRGYTNPSTEASLSRSMSGPSGPSILPSSAYGGFRDVEREVARQRQRKLHESRRQSKLLSRRTMLPSTPYARPSEADTESGSIDYLLAHSGSSFDSHSAYGRTPSTSSAQGSYLAGVSSSPYDNPYATAYGTSGVGSQTTYSSHASASKLQKPRLGGKAMASIFTFESEPPSLSSPWPGARAEEANVESGDGQLLLAGLEMPLAIPLADCGITKLEAEPQEGPTEYKLHLLLRPRRSFSAISTVQHVSGSYLSKSRAPQPIVDAEIKPMATPALPPSSQSKQNRLQHLTTQLLWRLQQSSPYHSSSKSSLVLPVLPEADVRLSSSKGPERLVPGLEESTGALYEIGVSDDGTFVGLTRDELEESLTVLRAMAFSLGCDVRILRVIVVGDCQWTEEEVLVAPHLGPSKPSTDLAAQLCDTLASTAAESDATDHQAGEVESHSEQLRVSLTGSTTSGKSSLLGTLSTSTLDNGRGKSRLSLLKHRHEIVSGVTSSLAQELIGYKQVALVNSAVASNINVINYASGNVSSWNDIHSTSEQGRLVFVTDSAGHPRYRRTTMRGLVSWAPHWTLCCVAADDGEDSTGRVGSTASSSEILGSAGIGIDLSKAHLDLCLKLNLPLVIVITKLDIATKVGMRNTLTKVLTTLKAAGRKPAILSSSSDQRGEPQLQSIAKDDEDAAKRTIALTPPPECHLLVPIVLTSAVTGSGIGRLHALLRQLPVNPGGMAEHAIVALQVAARPQSLFHVDEVFTMPKHPQSANAKRSALGFVLSGYLRYGVLEVGDTMLIGPRNPCVAAELTESPDTHRARSYPGLIKGSPRGVAVYDCQRPSSGDFTGVKGDVDLSTTDPRTWQDVRVTGLRNLRLPVRRLFAGQVGTVAITLQEQPSSKSNTSSSIANPPLRRGMVMIYSPTSPKTGPVPAYNRFTAVFPHPSLPAWPAVLVVVYIASIRASAKIVEVKALGATPIIEDIFDFDDDGSNHGSTTKSQSSGNQQTEITFEFVTSQEWIEMGTQVLVTPGGGPSLTNQPEQREPGSAGLDGYVGLITQAMV
ncbi:MAG: hypothetical protein ASARMPREDX12_006231 [Alectoria sarmentosa]|nr:MAG: hypothetical protein ASARMPREDX12_006231 [Alectoria sarmentosa]